MTRRMKTGAEPRSEYQLTETGKRIADAGLAHLRELIKNGVGK
jgi:DNA-binding HxlR family transcriptional regulator